MVVPTPVPDVVAGLDQVPIELLTQPARARLSSTSCSAPAARSWICVFATRPTRRPSASLSPIVSVIVSTVAISQAAAAQASASPRSDALPRSTFSARRRSLRGHLVPRRPAARTLARRCACRRAARARARLAFARQSLPLPTLLTNAQRPVRGGGGCRRGRGRSRAFEVSAAAPAGHGSCTIRTTTTPRSHDRRRPDTGRDWQHRLCGSFGDRAVSGRPLALRPHLAVGLPLSGAPQRSAPPSVASYRSASGGGHEACQRGARRLFELSRRGAARVERPRPGYRSDRPRAGVLACPRAHAARDRRGSC